MNANSLIDILTLHGLPSYECRFPSISSDSASKISELWVAREIVMDISASCGSTFFIMPDRSSRFLKTIFLVMKIPWSLNFPFLGVRGKKFPFEKIDIVLWV